jgi:hypothetical protein
MRIHSIALLGIISIALTACELPPLGAGGATKQGKFQIAQDAPEGAAAGTCWGKTETAAIIETVNREILVQPAQVSSDGRIQQPAIYKKETRQEIVQEREVNWIEIVCITQLTEDFTASLQRALSARGFYRGAATGLMDNRTRNGIRKFQAVNGFDNGILTIAAARKLGLVAVLRTE